MFMMKLEVKSLSKESLFLFKEFIVKILIKSKVLYSVFILPNIKKRITLLKSPHVNKTAREQFQFDSYKLLITLKTNLTLKELRFLILNKPKVVKLILKTL